jgi:polysaccharide biosynthesis protein PslG
MVLLRRLVLLAAAAAVLLAGSSTSQAGNPRFGIASGGGLQWLPPDELARELDGYVELGAQWLRFDFNWSGMEPEPGVYSWWRHDSVVETASARGLSVLGLIAYTPAWARPFGTTNKHPPSDPNDFARFVGETVRHYAPLGVRHWELWNEPNLSNFWQPCPDVEAYASMLRLAYAAVKEADPEAVVVSAGLSPAVDNGCNVAPRTFLAGLYANGAQGSFDVLGHHPYSFPAYPGEEHGWSAWHQMVGAFPSLRSLMDENGDGDKQIWATEWGARIGAVDEDTQAGMLSAAYALFGSYSWAGPLFVYTYRDTESFGLVRGDRSPRPAWYAYQEAAAGP